MKYALLIYDDPQAWQALAEHERRATYDEYLAVSNAPGVVGGAELELPHTATTVRWENDRMVTTDGPFAEAKEHLGGFYLLEADDLDTALELAGRIPATRMGGAVEVRPLVER